MVSVKPAMSEKQTVSFLRLLAIGDVLAAGEDRVVDLRREVLGELARERLEGGGFLRQALLPLLQLGDVRIDRDCAAILGAPLADHDPAAVAAPLHLRLAGIAVLRQALGDPFLDPALGVLDVARSAERRMMLSKVMPGVTALSWPA